MEFLRFDPSSPLSPDGRSRPLHGQGGLLEAGGLDQEQFGRFVVTEIALVLSVETQSNC